MAMGRRERDGEGGGGSMAAAWVVRRERGRFGGRGFKKGRSGIRF